MADLVASDESLYDSFLWDFSPSQTTDERLVSIANTVFCKYNNLAGTACSAVFYPYSDLKSTIKIERKGTRIRISDILRDAPDEVLKALIHILIARALRRKPASAWLDTFHHYIQRPEVEASHTQMRRTRSRKILSPPQGKYHDLDCSFQRVNRRYFQESLAKPNLSWSPTRSRRQLGYHDASLNLIVVSRYLDRRIVPEFMVDFIMYHELLHIAISPTIRQGKRIIHSTEFRRMERKFEQYDDALRWLGEPR